MDETIDLQITSENGVVVVALKTASICNAGAITAVEDSISRFIEQNHAKKVVIDFNGVKFFSSQMLGTLVSIRAKLKGCEGEVVISGINPQMYRVFRITNLDKIFRFFEDKEMAVKAVSSS